MHNSCLDMVKGMVKGRQKVKRKLRKERKDDPPPTEFNYWVSVNTILQV